jgi:hypothetical protein
MQPVDEKTIKIPAKPFEDFITSSHKWLAGTSDAHRGLELRLAKGPDSELHLSVGGDSHYIEASVVAPPFSLDAPVFLDLAYLANVDFDTDTITLVKPQGTEGKDRRAQFKAPGYNFRIPLRDGANWRRNAQDLEQFSETPGMKFSRETIQRVLPYMELPNSFAQKGIKPFAFETSREGFFIYQSDDFGAYWHTFEAAIPEFERIGEPEKLTLIREFFAPILKLQVFDTFKVLQSNRHTYGEVLAPGQLMQRIRWVQPNYNKPVEDIPAEIKRMRGTVESCISFPTKEFTDNIKKATSFFKEADMKMTPVDFSVQHAVYILSTKLPQSEMIVEGKTLGDVPNPLRVRFQANCLKDYSARFDKKKDLNLEVFRTSAILYQQQEQDQILYWMPIQDR